MRRSHHVRGQLWSWFSVSLVVGRSWLQGQASGTALLLAIFNHILLEGWAAWGVLPDEEFIPYAPCGPVFLELLHESKQQYSRRLNLVLYQVLWHHNAFLRVEQPDGTSRQVHASRDAMGCTTQHAGQTCRLEFRAPSSAELAEALHQPDTFRRVQVRVAVTVPLTPDPAVAAATVFPPEFRVLESEYVRKYLEAWQAACTLRSAGFPQNGDNHCLFAIYHEQLSLVFLRRAAPSQ